MSNPKNEATSGILSFGAYIPRLRISRSAIADGLAWAMPGAKSMGKGERSFANWDEDVITMAAEAGRECLSGSDSAITAVQLASTTFPFLDRSNSGVVGDFVLLCKGLISFDIA